MAQFLKRSTTLTDENYELFEDGLTTTVRCDLYDAKIGVDNVIRIRKEEYTDIDTHLKYFTHFNLQYGGMKIGSRYALPKILVQGYYKSDEDELPPLLSFEDFLIGTCVRVKENIPYHELSDIDFEYSMRSVKNPAELEVAILRRYRVSMPLLSDKEIIKMGVSVTTLRFEWRSGEG